MPLSSVVGAQSIVKPGVCTSSTRPASPYDGQVIYETDTDRAMVYNGTGWVVLSTGRANPVGLDIVSTTTIGTAVSSVDVTNCFSATYDNYLVSWTTTGSTGIALRLQYLTAASSLISTGYYYSGYYSSYSSPSLVSDASNNGSSFRIGTLTASTVCAGQSILYNPFTTSTKFWSGSHASTGEAYSYNGYNSSTASLPSIRITTNTGTITGGTITVYGYAK